MPTMASGSAEIHKIFQRMNAIVAGSEDIHSDEAARRALLGVNQELEASLRQPYEIVSCWAFAPGHMACIVLGADLGVFEALTEGARSVAELASIRHADEELVKQVLRTLVSMGFAAQIHDKYFATDVTRHISKPSVIAGVRHFFSNLSVYQRMPSFLRENGYQLPSSSASGPLQRAYATDKGAYATWEEMGLLDNFNIFMKGHFAPPSTITWLDWFSITELLSDFDTNVSPYVFVDIGGGKGHEGERLLHDVSMTSAGRFVLQDLAPVLNGIELLDHRIEKQEHDFKTPQPIRGARIYFMKDILHNYSDGECVHILTQLKPAIVPGYSKLLICNIILPEEGATLRQTGLDIGMLALHGGKQRDEGQWRNLLETSGFKVIGLHLPPGDGDGIIEAEVD